MRRTPCTGAIPGAALVVVLMLLLVIAIENTEHARDSFPSAEDPDEYKKGKLEKLIAKADVLVSFATGPGARYPVLRATMVTSPTQW